MDDLVPEMPNCEMDDASVETAEFNYSDRADGDFLVSGPLGETNGRGRWFETAEHALRWARLRYGARLKGVIKGAETHGDRWAFLIKGKS